MFLLNELNEEFLNVDIVKTPLNSSLQENLAFVSSINSPLLSECLGLTMTTVTCSKCNYSSSIYEPFSILSLSITEDILQANSDSEKKIIELLYFNTNNFTELEAITLPIDDPLMKVGEVCDLLLDIKRLSGVIRLFFINSTSSEAISSQTPMTNVLNVLSVNSSSTSTKKFKVCAIYSPQYTDQPTIIIPTRYILSHTPKAFSSKTLGQSTSSQVRLWPEELPMVFRVEEFFDCLTSVMDQIRTVIDNSEDVRLQKSQGEFTDFTVKVGLFIRKETNDICIICKGFECYRCFNSLEKIQGYLDRLKEALVSQDSTNDYSRQRVQISENDFEEEALFPRITFKIEGVKHIELFKTTSVTTKEKKSKALPDQTIDNLLAQFTMPETLKDDDMVQCSKCNEKTCDKKYTSIVHLPTVLILHIKRFKASSYSHFAKNTRLVKFGETLDMKKYYKKPSQAPATQSEDELEDQLLSKSNTKFKSSLTYKLTGVVNHRGSLTAGHYYSFVYDNANWVEFNDEIVTTVDSIGVVTNKAYILFYQKA